MSIGKATAGEGVRRMRNNGAAATEKATTLREEDRPRELDVGNSSVFDVVIIGAGWAGLAAAKTLLEKGVKNITVLEGRHYVGGRSHTVSLSDVNTTIELGSAWIHGANENNPVHEAAQKSGVQTIGTTDKEGVWSDVYGGNISHRLSDSDIDMLHTDGQGFFRFQRQRQDSTENDESLRQTLDMYIKQREITGDDLLGLEYVVDDNIAQEYAASLEDLSMWWWDTGRRNKGGDVVLEQGVHKGYTGVIDDISRPFLDKIWLNCKVTQVDYQDSTNIVVSYNQEGEDKEVTAHNVILTVPLGVLKQRDIKFIPELPSKKQEAIDKLGMGSLNKVILKWSDSLEMPWPDDVEWMGKIESPGNQGNWTSFHNQKSLTGFNILTAFIAGRTAEEKELLEDVELQNQVMESLQEMFVDVTISQPEEYVVTRWIADPFSRGSYSYYALGSDPSHRGELRRPVLNRLFFAGEACHEGYPSTTHGAYLSGVEAASLVSSSTKTSLGWITFGLSLVTVWLM